MGNRRLQSAVFLFFLSAVSLPAVENSADISVSTDDVTEETADVTENSVLPHAVPYIPLEISGSDDKLVDKYRKYYLTPGGVKWLRSVLEDGEQYRLYVRRLLKDRKMPAMLEYLPVVESSYRANAKSKAGALGLWQFMPNSTKPFLVCNDFADERLDPWKSTDAALTKLQENYNFFHDWPIAIAAYNCGAGAMARTLKKYPGKDFWYLAEHKLLRDQSVQYVPKLIAIADLAQNCAYYNITLPAAADETGKPLNPRAGYFDYVSVEGSISLVRLADELRMDKQLLFDLNAALTRRVTPPVGTWNIRVPEGMKQSAEDALSTIMPYTFRARYSVKTGDSLWGIAKKYNVTVKSLCEANTISESAVLRIGKILYIPAE
ncbi:MAG: transglycosylase SLT domain-containing protein [Treponema sp.]|nr:transglycosylase SLT domain-containing protein [Treponema sp.]